MSSAICTFIVRVLYLFFLLVIVIPISSVVTVVYVLLEPLQSCQLFSNSMKFLFENFVQWPLCVGKQIVSTHQRRSQSSSARPCARVSQTNSTSPSNNNANNCNNNVFGTANHSPQSTSSFLPPSSPLTDSSLTTVHVVRD